MTFEWSHRKLKTLNEGLKQFNKYLYIRVHPEAMLCYQQQYDKFTLSLFKDLEEASSSKTIIERSHLNIHLTSFELTPEIEQLADDLNEFIQRS